MVERNRRVAVILDTVPGVRRSGLWGALVSSTGVSLDIDIEDVAEVLLADGWHVVHDRTFELDDFDFTLAGRRVHGGGDSGVCATGFRFVTDEAGSWIAGPLTSILALRHGFSP